MAVLVRLLVDVGAAPTERSGLSHTHIRGKTDLNSNAMRQYALVGQGETNPKNPTVVAADHTTPLSRWASLVECTRQQGWLLVRRRS